MRTWRTALAAGTLALATGLTASLPAGADTPRPTGGTDVVLRVFTGGGLVPEAVRLGEAPELTVYGDGRMIVVDPTTLEYPGPALPNLRELHLTPAGVDRMVRLARAAGLFAADAPDYGTPQVTDNPSTTVTVDAGDDEAQVSVYALGFEDDRLTDEQQQNRERLQRLIARAEQPPRRFVLEGSERRYVPTALDVHTVRSGECSTATGADAAWLVADAQDRRADDSVVLVPLLPDQRGCSDDVVVAIDIGRNGWGGENSSFPYEEIVVHADGRIVADGVERQVDAAGLARILDAAAGAGLAGGGRDYGEPAITDQGSVVVEVATDDRSVHRVAVYALGMEDVDDGHLGLTRGQFRARRQLTRFIDLVAGAGAS